MTKLRCGWANPKNPRYLAYHDEEWGTPCHDEVHLFEMLNLEGAQAGLSWETILNKRDAYRAAFDGWDAATIAGYDDAKVASLLANPGIVRNRLKINATISNARAYLELANEFGGLDRYLWDWVRHLTRASLSNDVRPTFRKADRLNLTSDRYKGDLFPMMMRCSRNRVNSSWSDRRFSKG